MYKCQRHNDILAAPLPSSLSLSLLIPYLTHIRSQGDLDGTHKSWRGMESSFLNDCQWLEVSLNLAPWETGDNREPGRKMYPPLSNSWREGCAGFRGHLGTFYARILGSKYPEHDLEGGCKVNGCGFLGYNQGDPNGLPIWFSRYLVTLKANHACSSSPFLVRWEVACERSK